MRDYNRLPTQTKRLFDKVHGRHLNALGSELKQVYARKNVISMKSNYEERCIEVKFKHGELVKYYSDLTWG